MTFGDAFYHLKKYFIGSEKWNGLSIVDKKAIEKLCVVLRNRWDKWFTEVDEGLPIAYYTNGEVQCRKNDCTNQWMIIVDGRPIFQVLRPNDSSRGHRHEVAIYDNTVEKKALDEIIEPQLRGDVVLIHDAFDRREWEEISKERNRLIKEG